MLELLGVPTEPAAAFDAIQAQIEGVDRSEGWMNEQRARLLFFDGLQAARGGDPILATKRLEQLQALPTPVGSARTQAVFAEQLSLEINSIETQIAASKPIMAAIEEYNRKQKVYLERVGELDLITKERDLQKKHYDDCKKQRFNDFMDGWV